MKLIKLILEPTNKTSWNKGDILKCIKHIPENSVKEEVNIGDLEMALNSVLIFDSTTEFFEPQKLIATLEDGTIIKLKHELEINDLYVKHHKDIESSNMQIYIDEISGKYGFTYNIPENPLPNHFTLIDIKHAYHAGFDTRDKNFHRDNITTYLEQRFIQRKFNNNTPMFSKSDILNGYIAGHRNGIENIKCYPPSEWLDDYIQLTKSSS